MNLIEVKLSDDKLISKLARVHREAYSEKFNKDMISDNIQDYITETIHDIRYKRVFVNSDISCLIVCEDRTDKLLKNSTYHLITRIYVTPSKRKQGLAKDMVKYCQQKLGVLMGYDGKFFKMEAVK